MSEKNLKNLSYRLTKGEMVRTTSWIPAEWLEESQYYSGGKSEFVREAIFAHKNKRQIFKFRELLETLAGEILILSKWKEKGHPGGAKWTEKEEQQLEYYERCFSILENSPFNDKI